MSVFLFFSLTRKSDFDLNGIPEKQTQQLKISTDPYADVRIGYHSVPKNNDFCFKKCYSVCFWESTKADTTALFRVNSAGAYTPTILAAQKGRASPVIPL